MTPEQQNKLEENMRDASIAAAKAQQALEQLKLTLRSYQNIISTNDVGDAVVTTALDNYGTQRDALVHLGADLTATVNEIRYEWPQTDAVVEKQSAESEGGGVENGR